MINPIAFVVSTLALFVNAESRWNQPINENNSLPERREQQNENLYDFRAREGDLLTRKHDNESHQQVETNRRDLQSDDLYYRARRTRNTDGKTSKKSNIFSQGGSYSSYKHSSKKSNSSPYSYRSSYSYNSSYTYSSSYNTGISISTKSSKKIGSGRPTPKMPQTSPLTLSPTVLPQPPKGNPTTTPEVTPLPTRAPVTPPQPNVCVVNGEGLFGSKVGVAGEISFAYEITVFGIVPIEQRISIISKMETGISNGIIDDLFPQCSTVTDASKTKSQRKRTPLVSHRYGNNRMLRELQSNTIAGISSRPKDSIDESECSGESLGFTCFVVKGEITMYSTEKMNDSLKAFVENAISETINRGSLQDLDDRVLGVNARDLGKYPLILPTSAPTSATSFGGSTPDPPVLPLWAIIVIAVSGVSLNILAFLCFRRRKRHKPMVDDDSTGGKPSNPKKKRVGKGKKAIKPSVPSRPLYQPPPGGQQSAFGKKESTSGSGSQSPTKRIDSSSSDKNTFGKTQQIPGPNKTAFGASPRKSPSGNKKAFGNASTKSQASPAANSAFGPPSADSGPSSFGMTPVSMPASGSSTGTSDEFEKASESSEENVSLSDGSSAMEANLLQPDRQSSSVANISAFGDPDNAFGDNDNAFGIGMPMAPAEERYSSSSSYEEEVEEYEIEYVEDEDGLEEEFWDEDIVEEVVDEQNEEEQPLL